MGKIRLKEPLSQMSVFIERALKEQYRNKVVIFWSFLFPLIWYFLTIYLIIQPHVPEEVSMAPIKATTGISMGTFGAITVTLVGFSMAFASDLEERRYRFYRSLPVSPATDFLGRFLGSFIFALGSFTLVVNIAYLHGGSLALRGLASIPIVLLSLAMLSFIFVGMAIVIARFLKRPAYANIISVTLMLLLFFITGYNGVVPGNFPGEAWLINYIPNSLATRMMTYYLMGGMTFQNSPLTLKGEIAMPHGSFILVLLAFAGIFLFISLLLMYKSFYRGEAGE